MGLILLFDRIDILFKSWLPFLAMSLYWYNPFLMIIQDLHPISDKLSPLFDSQELYPFWCQAKSYTWFLTISCLPFFTMSYKLSPFFDWALSCFPSLTMSQ